MLGSKNDRQNKGTSEGHRCSLKIMGPTGKVRIEVGTAAAQESCGRGASRCPGSSA